MNVKVIGIFVNLMLISTAVLPVLGSIMNDDPTMKEVCDEHYNKIQHYINSYHNLGSWSEQHKLTASDGTPKDHFGWSVSIHGDYAIIGAYYDDDKGDGFGSAYIFKRTGTTWKEEQKLTASDGKMWDFFGWSVSIYGNYAIIGAPDDLDIGSAYIFKRTGTNWTEEQKLTASDGTPQNYFGHSVSIYENYAIIAAGYGSAYIFKRTGTTWKEEQKLTASDGEYVSIDGSYAIIGAPSDDNDNRVETGSAYIFKRTGTTWTKKKKLIASDGASGDCFGSSVSINGDYAIIGAGYEDSHGDGSGAAYVFKRTGTTWKEEQKLTASDGRFWDHFGSSVSIYGNYAIIGAYHGFRNGGRAGSAYIFKRTGTTWTEEQKLIASDGAYHDFFGYSVSIAGNYVMIGADGDDNENGASAGSVYVFKRSNQPPNAPLINGPTSGKLLVKHCWRFYSNDPDSDMIKYIIDWGDGKTTETECKYTHVEVCHRYIKQGKYAIKAKAKECTPDGLESEESTYVVTIPRNKATNGSSWLRFFDMFPILQRLLDFIN